MKGHVYRRGKTFTYVIDLPSDSILGERRQKSKGGFISEKEAWAACHIRIAEIEKYGYTEETKMSVQEYLLEYLETQTKPNFKET